MTFTPSVKASAQMASPTATGDRRRGFTLIELLVVMAIVATLVSIVAPRYFRATDDARESALKANLQTMREAIDHFHADRGTYPEALADLVDKRYLRIIPPDPLTGSATEWKTLPPPGVEPGATSAIYDVRSVAPGTAKSGEPYANW